MDSYFDRANGPMMRFFDLIYKWLMLNLLFLLFTIVGLGLFGVFPSLLTLFVLSKRLIQDKDDSIHLFQEYKRTFLALFKKGNLLFVFVVLVGGITAMDAIFLYNNYLGVDDITLFGVILSIGGLLLNYVVAGTIASIGVIVAYYERFGVKDTIKFALLTTLSNPLLIVQFLVVIGLGYLVFSILISAAPFIGVSMPVWGLVLLYKRVYFKIFQIKQDGNLHFMYVRYMSNVGDLVRIIEEMTSHTGEPVRFEELNRILSSNELDTIHSILVLDSLKHVIGFLLIMVESDQHHIVCMAVDKNQQRRGIGTAMLQHLLAQEDVTTVTCDVDMSHIHPSLSRINGLAVLLQQHGFQSVSSTTYTFTR